MATPETTIIFTSVIILVVIELSRIARDLDAEDRAKRDMGVTGLPNIGVFSLIHSANYILLFFGLAVTSVTEFSGNMWILLIMGLTYVVILIILPYLEVEEYEYQLHLKEKRNSYNYYIDGLIIITIAPLIIATLHDQGVIDSFRMTQFSTILVFVILIVVTNYVYLDKLRDEFCSEDRRTAFEIIQIMIKRTQRWLGTKLPT